MYRAVDYRGTEVDQMELTSGAVMGGYLGKRRERGCERSVLLNFLTSYDY